MELFKVERYKGDAISFENSTKNESKNLARLLEQARGRKRSRECANSKQTNNIKTDKADEEKSLLMRSSENARKKKNKKKEKLRRKLAEQESLNEKSLKNIDAVQEGSCFLKVSAFHDLLSTSVVNLPRMCTGFQIWQDFQPGLKNFPKPASDQIFLCLTESTGVRDH